MSRLPIRILLVWSSLILMIVGCGQEETNQLSSASWQERRQVDDQDKDEKTQGDEKRHTVRKPALPAEDEARQEAIKKAKPAVVRIEAKIKRPHPFNENQIEIVTNTGTGFFVHPSGYILTNNHVVGGGGVYEISVTMDSGTKKELTLSSHNIELVATLVREDLALIKLPMILKADQKGNLFNIPYPYIRCGDRSTLHDKDDDLKHGKEIVVLGFPHSTKSFDSAVGALRGMAIDDEPVVIDEVVIENALKTDIAINPGNSGGPIIVDDEKGLVVGIASAMRLRSESVNYAIPIWRARDAIGMKLMNDRNFKRKKIGIDYKFHVQAKGDSFFEITKVEENSPAKAMGLMAGDWIHLPHNPSMMDDKLGAEIELREAIIGKSGKNLVISRRSVSNPNQWAKRNVQVKWFQWPPAPKRKYQYAPGSIKNAFPLPLRTYEAPKNEGWYSVPKKNTPFEPLPRQSKVPIDPRIKMNGKPKLNDPIGIYPDPLTPWHLYKNPAKQGNRSKGSNN